MEPIPAQVVERIWKRVASLPPRRAPGLMQRMAMEQPVVLAYLLGVDDDLLNEDERQLLLYLGVVVWQIMLQGSKPLPLITEEMLDNAGARNLKMLEYLQSETEAGFEEATRTILSSYSQPEVLRYIIEALIEDPEKGCLIRDENRGAMMLDLKTIVDCFNNR